MNLDTLLTTYHFVHSGEHEEDFKSLQAQGNFEKPYGYLYFTKKIDKLELSKLYKLYGMIFKITISETHDGQPVFFLFLKKYDPPKPKEESNFVKINKD